MNTETEEQFKDTNMKLFGVPERENDAQEGEDIFK